MHWYTWTLLAVAAIWIAYRIGWHRGFRACEAIGEPLFNAVEQLGKALR